MSKENDHDFLLYNAGMILKKEEYQSKVVFDKKLLSILDETDSGDIDTVWYSLTNEEGFIQQNAQKAIQGKKLEHAINFTINEDNNIVVSFGDLLIHLDTEYRNKWKPFFKYTDSQINIAEKLLFPQNDDFELCEIYWNKRVLDNNDVKDLPWITPGDHEQIQQELDYLRHTWDDELHMTKDMKTLKFNVNVLDKYKNHKNCNLNIKNTNFCIISFLNKKGDVVLSANFFLRTTEIIMIYAKDFVFIPTKEREYWKLFEISDT